MKQPEQKTPRVTVWLSSYQHAAYLRRSIESILQQTFRDFELYVVDDCSTDGSWRLLKEYAARDPRIRLYRHRRNLGGSHMELLLPRLKGEYIAIAHSDDAWAPRKLEQQVTYLDAHPEVTACFTAVQFMDENGRFLQPEEVNYVSFRPESHTPAGWLRRLVTKGNCLCHPSAVLRRQAYRLPGALAQGFYALPDHHRWMVLAAAGQQMVVLPQKLTYFRLRANHANMSADTPHTRSRCQAELMFAAATLFDRADPAVLRRAFPEMEQWLPRRGAAGPHYTFALARALLQLNCAPGIRAEAARRLFGLMQRPGGAVWLRRRFGYTGAAFAADLARADLFNTGAALVEQQLQRQLAEQTARARFDEQALQAIRQSNSWQLTAPLRIAKEYWNRKSGKAL